VNEESATECAECDEVIDGEIVWYRPFGKLVWKNPTTSEFVAQASNAEMPNGLPLHPKCFEYRTGMKWPPESS
jgi:hypothetical protein